MAAVGIIFVGSTVKVRESVSSPAFGWRSDITHASVGTVESIDDEAGIAYVKFPGRKNPWSAKLLELELAAVSSTTLAPSPKERSSPSPKEQFAKAPKRSLPISSDTDSESDNDEASRDGPLQTPAQCATCSPNALAAVLLQLQQKHHSGDGHHCPGADAARSCKCCLGLQCAEAFSKTHRKKVSKNIGDLQALRSMACTVCAAVRPPTCACLGNHTRLFEALASVGCDVVHPITHALNTMM